MKLVVICALAASQGLFETPKALEEMQKHAHLETTMGEIVLDLLPEKAPNHVGYFIKMVEEDAYDHTSFHRVIKYGIIQGGDPKTKDPDARQDYGTGGLGLLARELNDEKHAAGAVSAVQIPGRPDSAGSQFFVVVTEQASLDGQYTVFARVVEGMRVVQKISEIPADENGKALERVEILDITLRDRPPHGDSAVLDRVGGGDRDLPSGPRELIRRYHPRTVPRPSPEPRTKFLAARFDRCLRWGFVSPHRSGFRDPDWLARYAE